MDESPIVDTAHPLQVPHLELEPAGRAGFAPLRMTAQPGNVQVEVTEAAAIIGRHSQADVSLVFTEISRRHCRVYFENGQWRILDLNSLNGVWINGERMHEAALYTGDRIRIGGCTLTVNQGTAVRVVPPPRKSDPEAEVLQSIAKVFPRQAG